MGLAGTVRRHERALIVAWLASCAALLGVIGVWGVGFGGAERVIELWNQRWYRRIWHAQDLVGGGRLEEAALYLERLDRHFPATWNRHRYDRNREWVLELLGTTHAELDHKKRCLETFERLAEFDPRNWRNHFLLGEHCRRFGEPERAEEAYREVLAIHPSHLPSVQALVEAKYDAGLFPEVTSLFEAYLDAWLLGRMSLTLGQVEVVLEVPVDGRPHTVEAPLALDAGWAGELCLATRGYSVRLSTVELVTPLRVGSVEPRRSILLRANETWTGRGSVERVAPSTWSALGPDAVLCAPAPASAPGGAADVDLSRVRVTLTVFKACPAELREQVEKSYANQLAQEAWSAASRRSVAGGCLAAGSLFAD